MKFHSVNYYVQITHIICNCCSQNGLIYFIHSFRLFISIFIGQSQTMLGSLASTRLGAIPCAIAWLFKGINERRQKTGARFSVRVSALSVNATKPGSTSRDLLAGHATGK